jgi:hypothetical protein
MDKLDPFYITHGAMDGNCSFTATMQQNGILFTCWDGQLQEGAGISITQGEGRELIQWLKKQVHERP